MGRNLAAPAIISGSRRSNGFNNRKMILTPGAFSFALPADVTEADIAIYGAGGGGALRVSYNEWNNAPGGGAGGGFARKRYRNLSGGTITGVIGSPGLGGTYTYDGVAANGKFVGTAGGTTTATLASQLLSATGGAGAPAFSDTTTNVPIVRAAGGVGSGGDINANGGDGGLWWRGNPASPDHTLYAPGGGAASGSHRGRGGDGGNAYVSAGQVIPAGGGGWGGEGGNATLNGNSGNAQTIYVLGGGSRGPGFVNPPTGGNAYDFMCSIAGGAGEAPFVPLYSRRINQTIGQMIVQMPIIEDWWDIEDIRGWGGSFFALTDSTPRPHSAGPGGGGSSGPSGQSAPPGFGGGGPGVTNNAGNKADGGVGGGGGGRSMTYANDGQGVPSRAGNGGPGCVIIWY